jgi:plastocyanin
VKRALLIAAALLALCAAAAYADQTIYAAPPNQYVGGDVTMAQGELVTFTNGDTVTHDVTAKGAGPDGKPLFQSDQIGGGQQAPVKGAEYLTTGTYDYICSIHPFMTGTITVTSEGTPKQRPGGGSGPPPQNPASDPSAREADTTAPSVSVKLLDTKRSTIRKRRSLQLSLTTNEAARVELTAKSGRTVVARGSANLPKAGTKKASIKLTKAGLRLMKKSRSLKVTVAARATDAAGNSSSAATARRVR